MEHSPHAEIIFDNKPYGNGLFDLNLHYWKEGKGQKLEDFCFGSHPGFLALCYLAAFTAGAGFMTALFPEQSQNMSSFGAVFMGLLGIAAVALATAVSARKVETTADLIFPVFRSPEEMTRTELDAINTTYQDHLVDVGAALYQEQEDNLCKRISPQSQEYATRALHELCDISHMTHHTQEGERHTTIQLEQVAEQVTQIKDTHKEFIG